MSSSLTFAASALSLKESYFIDGVAITTGGDIHELLEAQLFALQDVVRDMNKERGIVVVLKRIEDPNKFSFEIEDTRMNANSGCGFLTQTTISLVLFRHKNEKSECPTIYNEGLGCFLSAGVKFEETGFMNPYVDLTGNEDQHYFQDSSGKLVVLGVSSFKEWVANAHAQSLKAQLDANEQIEARSICLKEIS